MLSGDPLGAIIRFLPRPIFFGILTGIGLAYFASIALPLLQSLTEAEYGSTVAALAKFLGAGIALMPAPSGFVVFVVYLIKDVLAASRP